MRAYLDTNVLVDLVCSREPFLKNVQKLMADCVVGKIDLCISALSIVNTIYIGRKYGYGDLRKQLYQISKFVDVVDLKGMTVTEALNSDWKDYEDAVQYGNAMDVYADCIVTRNKKDFTLSTIPVYTVEELLETIQE